MGLDRPLGVVTTGREVRAERAELVRARMADLGVDVLLLSHGADLPWLTGYEAMPLERLTMLVFPADTGATLVVPRLEAPRVVRDDRLFELRAWAETEDPVDVVANLVGGGSTLAVSGRTWAATLLALQQRLSTAAWRPSSEVTSDLRAVKDDYEVDKLATASRAADRVASSLVSGEIPLVGRTELDVSEDLAARLRAEGHDRVNFSIVASGPNSASPHHDPSSRVIGQGEVVVCDFGGSLSVDGEPGYCSDITRTVVTGQPDGELSELYSVLEEAQAAAVGAARVGTACGIVDRVARARIEAAGYGPFFVHRTGHGIGLEAHEDPYLVAGNGAALREGNAFSVEPGIYVEGRFGARIEDIVVAAAAGPRLLNSVDRSLAVVEA